MRKILLLLALIPSIAFGQPFAKYQPPTPTPWMSTTPGAPGQSTNAFATNEFGQAQVVVAAGSGSIPITPANLVTTGTLDMTGANVFSVPCKGNSWVEFFWNRTAETGKIGTKWSDDGTNYTTSTNAVFYNGTNAEPYDAVATSVNVVSVNNTIARCSGHQNVEIFVQTIGTGAALPVTAVVSPGQIPLIEGIQPGTDSTQLGKAEDAPATTGDTGVFALSVRNDPIVASTNTNGDYQQISTDANSIVWTHENPSITSTSVSLNMTSTANATVIPCNGAGVVGIQMTQGTGTGVITAKGTNDAGVTYNAIPLWEAVPGAPTSGYTPFASYNVANGSAPFSVSCMGFTGIEVAVTTGGTNSVTIAYAYAAASNHVIVDGFMPGQGNSTLGASANSTTAGAGDTIEKMGAAQQNVLAASGSSGNYTWLKVDALGGLYVHESEGTTFTPTQPSVTTATSFTCLAANTSRKGFTIQNNTAANIMINPNNGTLTGIVPTATNLGIVLTPASSYTSPPNANPTAAITCYQTSGGTVNTISVVEY